MVSYDGGLGWAVRWGQSGCAPARRTLKTQSSCVSTTIVTILACRSGNDTPPKVPSIGLVEPPLDGLG